MTSQGLSDFAHRGTLRAAQAMALTGLELFISREDLDQVKSEFREFRSKNDYINPIPDEVKPSPLNPQ